MKTKTIYAGEIDAGMNIVANGIQYHVQHADYSEYDNMVIVYWYTSGIEVTRGDFTFRADEQINVVDFE